MPFRLFHVHFGKVKTFLDGPNEKYFDRFLINIQPNYVAQLFSIKHWARFIWIQSNLESNEIDEENNNQKKK